MHLGSSLAFLFLSRFLHLSTLWNFSWMDLQSLETQQETLKYFSPWISCLQPAFQWLKTEYRYNGFFYHDLQSAVDVSYTVDNSAIHLPFHISDDKKFVWNFTTSAVICPTLGKVCSPSVWASEGEFRYTNGGFEFVQCQFIIRRWSRRVCRVELDFQQFEMIQENNCLLNHFEIGGQHLCGNQTGRKSEYTSHYLRLDKLMWSMNELTLFLCFFVSFSSFPSGNWLSSIRANHTIAALTRKSSESVDRRETDAMPLVTWDKLTRAYYFFPRYLPLLSIQNPQPFDMVPYVIWME